MFYPHLPEDVGLSLDVIRQKLVLDPDYLDDPDCPYSDQLKTLLRGLGDGGGGSLAEIGELNVDWAEPEIVAKQIDKALKEIEQVGRNLNQMEANEKIAYLKAKSSLIEKLVTMMEKTVNIKQINDFRGLVIETLERHLDAAAITEFRKDLEGL